MNTTPARHLCSLLQLRLIALFVLAAVSVGNVMAAITVGPDNDPSCQFHHVGSAVAAAVQNPGIDLIQISTGTYPGVTNLAVTGADELIIEGGFANCSAGVSTGVSVLDGQGAAVPGSILTHFGAGKLRLLHLVLTHGDTDGGGGGINSQGDGELVLSDVGLRSNHAANGGGLYVTGGIASAKTVGLYGVDISSNTADASGGGVYAAYVNLSIDGDRLSYFLGNQAQGEATDSGDGGGMYVLNSDVEIHAASVKFPFIGSNHAARNGGGIYFGGSGLGESLYRLEMGNTLADHPLLIADNSADQGGAVYVRMESSTGLTGTARLTDARVENNEALNGAAFYVEAIASAAEQVYAGVTMRRSHVDTAVTTGIPCMAGVACNTISGNHAYQSNIVYARTTGSFATAQFQLRRGQVRDNVVDSGSLIGAHQAVLVIETSLIADNAANTIVAIDTGSLSMSESTVANNAIAAPYLFNILFAPSYLLLETSLLHDAGGIDAYSVGGSVQTVVRNLGLTGVSANGSNVQTLPVPFVDMANGDYHISLTSSAVDRWAHDGSFPVPVYDLDGASRPYVFNAASTPYDFGAYEAGAVIDTIFRDGFEPPPAPPD